MIRTNFDVT